MTSLIKKTLNPRTQEVHPLNFLNESSSDSLQQFEFLQSFIINMHVYLGLQ